MTSQSSALIAGSDPAAGAVAEAAALQIVTSGEIGAGLVTVRSVPGASTRTRALLVRNRPVAYVKQAIGPGPGRPLRLVGSRPSVVDPLERERQVLVAVAATRLGPRVIATTGRSLWTSAVCGVTVLAPGAAEVGVVAELSEVVRGWGGQLARLHRAGVPAGTPSAPVPTAAHLPACVREPVLAAGLGELADRWRPSSLIHGGLTPRSLIVDPHEPADVRLVGFGRSGVGDPGWDLAVALECLAGPGPAGSLGSARLAEELLLGYRRGGGTAQVEASYRAIAACWLAAEGAADQARHWLDRARDHARRLHWR